MSHVEELLGLDSDDELQPSVETGGPVDRQYMKVVSIDGHEFLVDKDVAMCCATIRTMLSGPAQWSELSEPVTTLKLDYSGFILEKVFQYCYYRSEFQHADSSQAIPDFPIESEYVFPLMQAAHYLGV